MAAILPLDWTRRAEQQRDALSPTLQADVWALTDTLRANTDIGQYDYGRKPAVLAVYGLRVAIRYTYRGSYRNPTIQIEDVRLNDMEPNE